MAEPQEPCEHPGLPLDVVQIVLGYVNDTRSMAAARQVCKAWHSASSAATATVSVGLQGSVPEMRSKLSLLLHVMPSLAGCHLTVGAGAAAAYPAECFRQLLSFPALKSLELKFTDSLVLTSDDVTQLACLSGLTRLHLYNVSLPAPTNSSPLLQLKDLQELSLVHHSKVSALLVGDSHLSVLGSLTGLTDLVLQGRMCSASDSGLWALSGLTRLHSLAISWVPWQSQITQAAALQLLSALKQLKTLQLGGAELLLPSIPQFPVAAVHAAPPPPAALVAAVAAEAEAASGEPSTPGLLPHLSSAMSLTAAASGAAVSGGGSSQTDVMRSLLLAKACELDHFKLQFNCCGTGVEKALLALGDVCDRLTGLQWSYAKLAGPSSTSLLAACSSLTSLKLRLWYQDYNLRPFTFQLSHLTTLTNLRSLVIDKRPPFQQQLPVQQNAISIPLTPDVLQQLTGAWGQLQKLQLGLSRSDFGPTPLQGLAGFTQLKSLSVHCYDQGYDDGQYMLPIDITCLPSSLIKADLMHAELFSSSNSHASSAGSKHHGSCCSHNSRSNSSSIPASAAHFKAEPLSGGSTTSGSSSSSLRSYSSSSSCAAPCTSRTVSGSALGGNSSSSFARPSSSSKVNFAAASAHTFATMLSESFSVLSRQASVDPTSGYMMQGWPDQQQAAAPINNNPQQQQQQQQMQMQAEAYYPQYQQPLQLQQQQQVVVAPGAPGPMQDQQNMPAASAFASAGGALAAAAVAAAAGDRGLGGSSTAGIPPVHGSSSWLQDLMQSLPAIPPASSDSSSSSSDGNTTTTTSVAAITAAGAKVNSSSLSSSFINNNAEAPCQQQLLPSLPEQRAVLPAQHDVCCSSSSSLFGPDLDSLLLSPTATAASVQQQNLDSCSATRKNPFAAASAAAAVHAAIGGCVAAVDSDSAAAASPADADTSCSSSRTRDQDKLPRSHSSSCTKSSSSSSSKLVVSLSVMQAAFKASTSSSSSNKGAVGGTVGGGCGEIVVQQAYLPHLQQLQLKHCSLVGVSLEDIITKPAELRVLQLVEVLGLSPHDIALLPYLAAIHRLTLIAAREDSWLGLGPLRLLTRLQELRHLDWVVSDKALSGRHSKAPELQALTLYPKLHVLTVHTLLGRCEQLHAVSGQLNPGCSVRLMTPAFCEHASKKTGFGIGKLLGVASCLLPGTVPVM